MCQFNIIYVKNIKNKELLTELDYNNFGKDINAFSPFVKGFCNCNSFVGSMCEYNGNSYFEMIESSNKAELERLYEIRNFMNQPNYIKLREDYIKSRDSLGDTLDENSLMEESTSYFLTKEYEEKEYENAQNSDLINELELFEDLSITPESIVLPEEESMVIDTVIQRLENKYKNDYNTFLDYKQLFEKLLENESYILFSCIWDEPRDMTIKKETNIKDLTIEDLACLKFNEIIKIYK